mgnify:CR=1 FL=1
MFINLTSKPVLVKPPHGEEHECVLVPPTYSHLGEAMTSVPAGDLAVAGHPLRELILHLVNSSRIRIIADFEVAKVFDPLGVRIYFPLYHIRQDGELLAVAVVSTNPMVPNFASWLGIGV